MSVEIISMARDYSYQSGWTGKVVWKMLWTEIDAFVSTNATMIFPGSSAGGGAALSVQSFSCEPWDGANTVVTPSGAPDHAKVTGTFALDYLDVAWPNGVTRPSYKSGTTLKLKVKFSGQFLTLPPQAVSVSDPSYKPTSPNSNQNRILIPLLDFVVEQDRLPWDGCGISWLRTHVGNVNDAAFMGCVAETLLLESVDLEPSFVISTTNPHRWKMVYTLKQRRITGKDTTGAAGVFGWNHDYHDNPPGWMRITMTDGSPRYPTYDFDNLFM